MANELVAKDFGKYQIADVFKNTAAENDLSSGIQGGFAVIGYKGKTWSRRSRGEEILLMRPDGDGPRSSIDVVILASAKVLSKTWYEKGYVEGSAAPPDCWSGNSIHPNAASPKLQSPTCATCPRNVWGGRITENNKRAKECADAKRLAVAFVDDLDSAGVEPLMLRVPAASLSELASFGNEMSKLGFPYYSILTKVTFDPEESYPKFKFTAVRPLTNEEGERAIELRNDAVIERILDETGEELPVELTAAVVEPQKPEPVKKAPPKAKTINATAENGKSKVTPRKAASVEEIEDATVVETSSTEEAAEAAGNQEEGEADEAFDKALDAKLSAFLGGNKS